MLDIIGDIHGHADRAKHLLKKLGYRETNGAFRHPERQALFLGDLVDRGPQQVETVNLVRRMVDAGNALAIMGNHEYNAVAYATPDPDKPSEFLRKNTKRNRHQHAAFLDQVGEGSDLHREMISWFKQLPIAFENEGFRAIHACWHQGLMDSISHLMNADLSLKESAWVPMSRKGSPEYNALETLLKGLEIELPDGLSYQDKDGVSRTKTRTRWWDEQATTFRELGLVPSNLRDMLPDEPVDRELLLRYDNKKLAFVGHYWMSGEPGRLTSHTACLDYSIGKGTPTSKLCAYRWSGETVINNENFIWVDGPQEKKLYEAGLSLN